MLSQIKLSTITGTFNLDVFKELKSYVAIGEMNVDRLFTSITPFGMSGFALWSEDKTTFYCNIQYDEGYEHFKIHPNKDEFFLLNLGPTTLYFRMNENCEPTSQVVIRTLSEVLPDPADPSCEYRFRIRYPNSDDKIVVDLAKAREHISKGFDPHELFGKWLDVVELRHLKDVDDRIMTKIDEPIIDLTGKLQFPSPIQTNLVFNSGNPGPDEQVIVRGMDMNYGQADHVHQVMCQVIRFLAHAAGAELQPPYQEFILRKGDVILGARNNVIAALMAPKAGTSFLTRYMVYQDILDDSGGVSRLHQKSCDSLIEALAYNFANSYHGILISDSSDPSGWREMDNQEIADGLRAYY